MKPTLYDVNTADFSTDGMGTLADCISCTVTEERNGVYELQAQYPQTGAHFDDITVGRYLRAAAHPGKAAQIFKIYSITRPLDGIIDIKAEHISYELSGNPVLGFSASGTADSMLHQLFAAGAFNNPFTVTTDFTGSSTISIPGPSTIRGILGGMEGSFLDRFHGEYEFDNFEVILWSSRGADKGVTVEYGKNLTDITQDEIIESTYTSIVPYARQQQEGEEVYIYLPEKYLDAPNAGFFARRKAMFVDFSSEFDQQQAVSVSKLRQLGQAYIKDNDIGTPSVSLKVSFVDLRKTMQYAGAAPLESVNLCDTITVRFPRLGVDTKAKVIRTVYDSLLERYDQIEIGAAQINFVKEYAAWQQTTNNGIGNVINQILTQTQLITGNKGGYVVMSLNEFGEPEEILIMDAPDKNTAKNVWRWNLSGLGFSSHGYNGPFDKIALTMDGQINASMITTGSLNANIIKTGSLNADLITTGSLSANRIKGGVISDTSDKMRMDLNAGSFALTTQNGAYRMTLHAGALRVFNTSDGKARLLVDPIAGFAYLENGATTSSINSLGVLSDNASIRETFTFKDRTASWTYDSGLKKYVLTAEE